ncbi:MAG: HAMP domain-containing sensor histidine kinase [Pseudomonadota bacterium]
MTASLLPSGLADAPDPRNAGYLATETQRHLLRLLGSHMPSMILANLVVATVMSLTFWGGQGDPRIGYWLLLSVTTNGLRWAWNRRVGKRLDRMHPDTVRRAALGHTVLSATNGMIWGALAWIAFNGEHANLDFVTIAIIVGMTAGGLTPLSTLPLAFPLYASAALLPFIFKAFWLDGHIYLSGGVVLTVYLVILLSYSRSIHDTLSQSFRLQIEKDHLIRELETLSRSRSLFLAGVSHDLKQPVQALGMFTACLDGHAREQPGPLGEELQRLAHNSALALAAIGGQISRLLELSRLEAGEIQPHRRMVRVSDLFDYTRVQQAEKAGEKGLKLRFVATRLSVVSDLKMLQSILDNLVSNAVRYTSEGGVLVGVRRRGGRIEIQVLDTGPGIPQKLIPLLFEAYRRFDDTAPGAELGHGLGLALVKRQVQLLGHDLLVRSVPGQGSMFSVLLPRVSEAR